MQIRRREGKGSPRGRGKRWRGVGRGCGGLHSQSRCFFLGPMISWVVALHTVLDTAEPVTLCWAAVIRSVRLWPDISAACPPPLPLRSRPGLGPPKRPRVPTPHRTPYPHRLLARLPAWGGAQGRAPPPARRAPARVFPTGSHTKSGRSRAPRLSLSPPLPWSAGARPGKRDRQLQENGGARLLLGAFRAAPVSRDSGSAPCSLPPAPSPFPFLSSPARPPPSLRRGKSGAAPARYVVEPARRAQQEARPRGRRGPPRHVTLPANRSPEARPRVS